MISIPYYRGVLSYPNKFTSDSLTVIVNNGSPITIPRVIDGVYGTTGIPGVNTRIRIIFEDGVNYIDVAPSVVSDVGDYNVKIQDVTPSKVETTECFKKAVQSVSSMMLVYHPVTSTVEGATWSEAYNALESNVMLFLNYEGNFIPCTTYTDTFIAFDRILADSTGVTNFRVQWHYDGTVTTSTVTYPSQS